MLLSLGMLGLILPLTALGDARTVNAGDPPAGKSAIESQRDTLLTQASGIAETLDEPWQKARLWLALADAYANAGDRERAQSLLNRVDLIINDVSLLVKQSPHFYDRSIVQEAYDKLQEKLNPDPAPTEPARALSLRQEYCGDIRLTPTVIQSLKSGGWKQALPQALRDNKGKWQGSVLIGLAWEQVELKQYSAARQTYLHATELPQTEGPLGDDYLDFITLAGVGDVKGCLRLYQAREESNAGMFQEIVPQVQRIFVDAGDAGALEVLVKMKDIDDAVDVYSSLVEVYLHKKDFKKALATAQRVNSNLDSELQQKLRARVALELGKAGRYSESVALAATVLQPPPDMRQLNRVEGGTGWAAYRDLTLKDVALMQARAGLSAEALQTVRKIGEAPIKGEALGAIAFLQLAGKKMETVRAAMLDVAAGDMEVRRVAFTDLARSLTLAHQTEAALSLAAQETPYIKARMWVAVADGAKRTDTQRTSEAGLIGLP